MSRPYTPIETIYRGYRFRSRLEARWAVFYDALKVNWIYESQGFELDGLRYLPDFHIRDIGWIEIKPIEPTNDEKIKATVLASATGEMAYIFYGNIPYPAPSLDIANDDSAIAFYPNGAVDPTYCWCQCQTCGKFGVQYEGRSERICQHNNNDKGRNDDELILIEAYKAARAARFEFNETKQ